MMKHIKILFFLIIMILPLLVSCDNGSGKGHARTDGDTLCLKYAENLTMVDYGDYTVAKFRNPWDTTRTLETFVLVPRDKQLPADLPQGTVVRVPLQRSIVYTSVHNSLLEELGALDAIAGVCDAKYIHKQPIRERIDGGAIADCGTSMTPNIEKILMIKPDAILLSAFENSNDHNKVAQVGIPIIDCIDYMETSPLGRAEWIRFFGRLYGKSEVADSIFAATEKSYNDIKAAVAGITERPAVLTDLIYGQTWNMPGAYSTTGVLIEDAGGKNPFDTYKKSGSVQLAPEEVLFKAKDADFWLIKYSQNSPMTMRQLGGDNAIYSKFNAYANGNVYGCNTDRTSYYEEASFHPHWLLAEFAEILHPELGTFGDNHHYYEKIQP